MNIHQSFATPPPAKPRVSGDRGALPFPVSASVAHLKVKGTARVASLAIKSSTKDQTTRIFRSERSLGHI